MNILNKKHRQHSITESKFLQWQNSSNQYSYWINFLLRDSVFCLAVRKSRCPVAFLDHQSVFINSVMESLGHTAELKAVFPSVMDSTHTLLGLFLRFLHYRHSCMLLSIFQRPYIFKTNGESPFRVPVPQYIEDGMQNTDEYKLNEKLTPMENFNR